MSPALQPLAVDLYELDCKFPDWRAFVADGRWPIAILKASEGLYYNAIPWLTKQWQGMKDAGVRIRGAYHFLSLGQDGASQADYFDKIMAKVGGWQSGDLWPIVDVELGGSNAQFKATAQMVIDHTSEFIARMKAISGRDVVLYGMGAMRDTGVTDRMGARFLWAPRYTSTLPRDKIAAVGWSIEDVLLWQYGDGEQAYLPGYPVKSPVGGDVNVLTLPGGIDRLTALLSPAPLTSA